MNATDNVKSSALDDAKTQMQYADSKALEFDGRPERMMLTLQWAIAYAAIAQAEAATRQADALERIATALEEPTDG